MLQNAEIMQKYFFRANDKRSVLSFSNIKKCCNSLIRENKIVILQTLKGKCRKVERNSTFSCSREQSPNLFGYAEARERSKYRINFLNK